jgi:hypothetical protein
MCGYYVTRHTVGFRMPHIELPRPIVDYFAFAELERAADGRRFSITLTYLEGDRLDRINWWWRVNATQEKLVGEAGVAKLRAEATERFQRHVERWLENTRQRLTGDGPFPRLEALPAEVPAPALVAEELPSTVIPLPQRATGTG